MTSNQAWDTASVEEKKHDVIHDEGDAASQANVLVVTPEDDKRVCRLIDKRLLPILIWVYFLQILDKYLLGLAAVWGLREEAGLHGNEYSTMASMNAIAQLVWLPFSSYLLVRLPAKYYMAGLVFGWGGALLGMGFSKSYASLCATRFLLGLFEAACLPLFAMITSQWYRRQEQPLRVATWYGTNGLATMFGSLMSFGIGHVKSPHISSWQLVFIIPACLTILTAPVILYVVPSNIDDAKWLTEHDRAVAYERVRFNQTGTGSSKFKVPQLLEALWDPKTWIMVCTSILLNAGANVTGTFGGLLVKGLGFDNYKTSLLNMPFGAVQLLVIVLLAWIATRFKFKGVPLAAICVPVLVGCIILVTSGRAKSDAAKNLVGYYLLGFIFAGNPLIVTWLIANTAGSTKKAVVTVMYNIGSSAGNIIGPFLFQAKEQPYYRTGLKIVMGVFAALFALVILQMFLLITLNKLNAKKRVELGMEAVIVDRSMMTKAEEDAAGAVEHVEHNEEDDDITDMKNPRFVYVL
ncbi:major facilitator superfamily domain-containing protein [Filobasidium floriforme]|uniref:major facilitator superfamily domain-containing protein n=1 Tax=Filobasidium floriforme TaxID=5210 RepID=UPI001E8D3E5B|nr:major facilitator superfamily domain-containing protein [Filobasidium floriforme]KAH8089602.1 major facilitator superfamily domain-containing protein [Filobasidium floriforme]